MEKKLNWPLVFFLAVACAALAPLFARNIAWLIASGGAPLLFQGRWDLVVLYSVVFSSFALLSTIRLKKGRWKSAGLYAAFVIALFAEMFGFPLTVYFLSAFAGGSGPAVEPVIAAEFQVFGVSYRLLATSLIAGVLSAIGFVFIALGWRDIYRAKGKLVTKGIYSLTRHPQYFGILLVAGAWLFAWPTLPTLALYPFLVLLYYHLMKEEEREMEEKFELKYRRYKEKTSMFLPSLYK